MEDFVWEDEVVEAAATDNKTFGEPVIERRYIQIPREAYRKFLSYEEWRELYTRIINKEDWNKPLEERTPEWKKKRAIKIMWEEGLSESEYKAKIYKTSRPFSPEVQKIIDYNKYLAENFDKVWNEIEEEWEQIKAKKDLVAAAVENEQEKGRPQRYEVDWSQLDGLQEVNVF